MRRIVLSLLVVLLTAVRADAIDCGQARAAIETLRRDATVTMAAASTHFGVPVRVAWTQPGQTGRIPAYLMIAFDKPVRFNGKDCMG